MNTFRTRRPLLVNATQCLQPTLISPTPARKAYPGDWIIEGENHDATSSTTPSSSAPSRPCHGSPSTKAAATAVNLYFVRRIEIKEDH